jgi:RES domain-containing protein
MFTHLNAALYRIVFAQHADSVLDGVIHQEGRFHHDGQLALYASPSRQTAAIAIRAYLKEGDPARVIVPLALRDASMVDLRDPDTCADLSIDPAWPSVLWSEERTAGQAATSWRASDAVRASGADGMIYASRTAPERWHVVLFSWNQPTGAALAVGGVPVPWVPNR